VGEVTFPVPGGWGERKDELLSVHTFPEHVHTPCSGGPSRLPPWSSPWPRYTLKVSVKFKNVDGRRHQDPTTPAISLGPKLPLQGRAAYLKPELARLTGKVPITPVPLLRYLTHSSLRTR
jgi:hypothetical protein